MPDPAIEGRILIDLFLESNRVDRAGIASSRPVLAGGVFVGRARDEVLRDLPLVFNVCRLAQSCAGAGALERAMLVTIGPLRKRVRKLLVNTETIKEHLWRIFLDWPAFLYESKQTTQMRAVQAFAHVFAQQLAWQGNPFDCGQALKTAGAAALSQPLDELRSLAEKEVYAMPLDAWYRIDNEPALQQWLRQADTVAARMLREIYDNDWCNSGRCDIDALPALAETELDERLAAVDATEFIARPTWNGRNYETTPYTRQQRHPMLVMLHRYGNGLLSRMIARLLELALCIESMAECIRTMQPETEQAQELPAVQLQTGTGVARAEAARGCLIHRVELEQGLVRQYQILAPTEWNFHPAGVLARGLTGLTRPAKDSLERLAGLIINSIDPCVGYELRIH